MNTHLLANVHIPILESLEHCASRLSVALDGVIFAAEGTGRFEEVPAYVGIKNGAEFVLFGVPAGESTNEYSLTFSCGTVSSVSKLAMHSGISFLLQVPDDRPANAQGFVDVSLELSAHLNALDFAFGEAVVAD